jgi:hypothetical protein
MQEIGIGENPSRGGRRRDVRRKRKRKRKRRRLNGLCVLFLPLFGTMNREEDEKGGQQGKGQNEVDENGHLKRRGEWEDEEECVKKGGEGMGWDDRCAKAKEAHLGCGREEANAEGDCICEGSYRN